MFSSRTWRFLVCATSTRFVLMTKLIYWKHSNLLLYKRENNLLTFQNSWKIHIVPQFLFISFSIHVSQPRQSFFILERTNYPNRMELDFLPYLLSHLILTFSSEICHNSENRTLRWEYVNFFKVPQISNYNCIVDLGNSVNVCASTFLYCRYKL